MCVDVSKGRGVDYSSFSIIDVTGDKFEQVAVFRDNMISPLIYPDIIIWAATQYNEALVIIENNDAGHVVCNALYYEHEYENTFTTSTIKNSGIGVMMTKKIKRIGCSTLKDLTEGQKLIIHDPQTISELSSFEPRGNSFEARPGTHDDMVMTLVMFSWFASTDMFRSMTDQDLKELLYHERILELQEDLPPFGIINRPASSSTDNTFRYAELAEESQDWNEIFGK